MPAAVDNLVVGVVGPCSAGKSTLVQALQAHGYQAKHIAQEHSYAPRMWQVIGRADVLIYLDVTYPVAQARRWMNWRPADLAEQQRRLAHARAHCDLYVATDDLDIAAVRERVLAFLAEAHRAPGSRLDT
jgi:deoxyadenosine/deoxycytidine kinase